MMDLLRVEGKLIFCGFCFVSISRRDAEIVSETPVLLARGFLGVFFGDGYGSRFLADLCFGEGFLDLAFYFGYVDFAVCFDVDDLIVLVIVIDPERVAGAYFDFRWFK